ncbi:6-phosphogluconolactonase [Corynebacterium capitovis DSM 44611]|uniref:6-phosphogluconolactonase n=1 Tax=Corynebacterium capitovis TaxID=131081 RepID=UPI00036A1FF6|nr:6-phosphogluconolactonase [Corynebacterium capitovis]WKD57621.1 6-phosphogluconolactonase [Corynebacterium capitovis DSM 44611]
MDISRYPDLDSLLSAARTRFVQLISAIHADPVGGVNGDGSARIVATGGTAGIAFLASLVDAPVDWSRVHVYFGDERNVPVTHDNSNEKQARDALLDRIAIPGAHIHGYRLTGAGMDEQAESYERDITITAPEGFDLHLLGMGGEGHVNSLFPHTPALAESSRLVVPVTDSPKPPAERVTLTLPAISRARRVWLLVSGKEKAEAAGHAARGDDPATWPAAGVRGAEETLLLVTEDAATRI